MTAALRERAEHAAKYGSNLMVPARDIQRLLNQLDQAVAEQGRLRAKLARRSDTVTRLLDQRNQAEARIQAARAVCAKPMAVKVQGSSEADAAAAAVAAVVLRALDGDPQ